MVGVLNGHISLWIIFIIFYIFLCIYVSFNIYFLSYVKRGVQGVVDEWTTDHDVLKAIEPKRKGRFTFSSWFQVKILIRNFPFSSFYIVGGSERLKRNFCQFGNSMLLYGHGFCYFLIGFTNGKCNFIHDCLHSYESKHHSILYWFIV